MKTNLSTQLEAAKHSVEAEQREKRALAKKLQLLETEYAQVKNDLEEEQNKCADLQRQVAREHSEGDSWRVKYESEGPGRVEELQNIARKLKTRLQDAEEMAEAGNLLVGKLEKDKKRLQGENEDMACDVEKVENSFSTVLTQFC